jgi:hypothetical protein
MGDEILKKSHRNTQTDSRYKCPEKPRKRFGNRVTEINVAPQYKYRQQCRNIHPYHTQNFSIPTAKVHIIFDLCKYTRLFHQRIAFFVVRHSPLRHYSATTPPLLRHYSSTTPPLLFHYSAKGAQWVLKGCSKAPPLQIAQPSLHYTSKIYSFTAFFTASEQRNEKQKIAKNTCALVYVKKKLYLCSRF